MTNKNIFWVFTFLCLMICMLAIPPAQAVVFEGYDFDELIYNETTSGNYTFDASWSSGQFLITYYVNRSFGSPEAFYPYKLYCGDVTTLIAQNNMFYTGIYWNDTYWGSTATNYRTGADHLIHIPLTEYTFIPFDQMTQIRILIDMDNLLYSQYFNGVADRVGLDFGTGTRCINKLNVNFASLENYTMTNLTIYATDELEADVSLIGHPCDNSSMCITGYCEPRLHICQLKPNNYPCDEDIECLSGDCYNEKCTKPSLMQLVDASKNESFGDDTNTNNLLSLIIMTFVCLMCVMGGYQAGHTGVGVAGGILLFIVLGIFFAMIGWLSAIIVLGMLLILILLAFIGFMIGGN